MKLSQLEMFKTVAELGSLKEASVRLHKTPPAISQAIRQLESDLNLTLFSRAGYRLATTDAGARVFQHAVRILKEVDALRQVAGHIAAGNEAVITFAIEASYDLQQIMPLLNTVQHEYPDTQIVLRHEYITGAIEALDLDSTVFCISPLPPQAASGGQFEFCFLNTGCLMNVASPKLLERYPGLRSSEELINEYQVVLQDSGSGTKGQNWGVQDGQRRWYVNDFTSKAMLIKRGMGWGRLPDYYARPGIESGELVLLNLDDSHSELHLQYHLIKRRGQQLGPVAQTLWDRFASSGGDPT